MPEKAHALIRAGAWEIPEIFHLLQRYGEVDTEEMFRIFNMGIGMCLFVEPTGVAEVMASLKKLGTSASPIGTVEEGGRGVVYDLDPKR